MEDLRKSRQRVHKAQKNSAVMQTVTVEKEQLNKVLKGVETLLDDVEMLLDQDQEARRRFQELKRHPELARDEKELDDYLKRRGVKVD